MNKNIAFVRVSTNIQDTISQEDAIKDYCHKNKIVIDEFVKDAGVSGFSIPIEQRESLQYIKTLALNKELDTLIVFNSDRIARRTEASMYLKLLASCGVKIVSVTEGELFKNEDIDELLTFIRFYQAQTESKKTSNRVRSAKKYGFENGNFEGGKVNYGYKLVDGKLEINENEATIVKKLYEIYNSYGTTACLQWLDENNITKRGYNFTANTVVMLLKNSIYYGQPQGKYDRPYNKELQIVSYDIWKRTQDLLNERRTVGKTKHTNKSSALLESIFYHKVGDQLHKLYVDYTYTNKNKNLVYRCATCKMDRNRPKKTKYNFNGNKYHKIIGNEIVKVLNTLSVDRLESEYCKRRALELTVIQSEIDSLTNTLKLKKKALEGANDTLEKIFNGTLSIDITIVSNKIKELQSDIITIENNVNILDTELHQKELEQMNKHKLVQKYKDFNYLWDMADNSQKKAILQELVQMIIIDNDNIEIKLNL